MMKLNNYTSERLTVGAFFRILKESGLWNGRICADMLFSRGIIQILRKDITPGIECIQNTYFMRQVHAARAVAFQVKIQPEFSHESQYDLRRDLQQGYEALGIEGIITQFLNRKVDAIAMPFSDRMSKEGGAILAKYAFPYWDLETPEMLSAAGRLGYFLRVDFMNSSNNILTDNVLYSKLEAFTSKAAFCEEMMNDPKIEQYRKKYKEMEDRMAEQFGEDCLVRYFLGRPPLPCMFQSKSDRDATIRDIIRNDVLDIADQTIRTADNRRRMPDPGGMNELINDFREMTWNTVDVLNKKYCIKWASLSNSCTV